MKFAKKEQEEVPQVPIRKEGGGSENKLDSNLTVYVSRDVCEGCHMSGKPFMPGFVNGSIEINKVIEM